MEAGGISFPLEKLEEELSRGRITVEETVGEAPEKEEDCHCFTVSTANCSIYEGARNHHVPRRLGTRDCRAVNCAALVTTSSDTMIVLSQIPSFAQISSDPSLCVLIDFENPPLGRRVNQLSAPLADER